MDEAVIRIVMQDAPGQQPGRQSGRVPSAFVGVPPLASGQPSSPQAPQQRTGTSAPKQVTPSPPPDNPETNLDAILKVADSLRGTIGGLTGVVMGAAIDALMAFRKSQQSETSPLIPYVQETTSAVHGVENAVKGLAKPAPPPKETKVSPPETAKAPPPAFTPPAKPIAIPSQEPILAETEQALKAVGMPKDLIRDLLEKLRASGESFASVQDAFAAAYRVKQGLPITTGMPQTPAPSTTPVATPPTPQPQGHPAPIAMLAPAGTPGGPYGPPTPAAGTPSGPYGPPTPPVPVAQPIPVALPAPPATPPIQHASPGTPPPSVPLAMPKGGIVAGNMFGSAASQTALMSGLSTAVPVAGAVIMALKAIDEALMSGAKSIGAAPGKIAAIFAEPSADAAKGVDLLGASVVKAGEKINNFVPMVGYFIAGLGSAIQSLAAVMQNLDRLGERYGAYSPEIATSQALADVRLTLGDFQRAQQIAPELSRYIDQRSTLQDKFENLKIKMLSQILPAVTKALGLIEKGMPVIEAIVAPVGLIAKIIAEIFDIISEMLNLQQDARADFGDLNPTTAFMQGYIGTGGNFGVRVPEA